MTLAFDMDSGTYNVWFDGDLILEDETHGVWTRGVGAVLLGLENDPDLEGQVFVDNLRVAISGDPCVPGIDYLIVCPDPLYDSALGLKSYRERTGHVVSILRLSDVAPGPVTADQIDEWIEDCYGGDGLLKYIALVGDVSLLPSFTVIQDQEEFYSDLRYAVTDSTFEEDYLPRVCVGRIPVNTPGELESYVDKLAMFETTFGNRDTIVFF
ncbi:MAG: C25 family cysteine peptidase, partial [bacterium]